MYSTFKDPLFNVTYVLSYNNERLVNFMDTHKALAGVLLPGESLNDWMIRKAKKQSESMQSMKSEKKFNKWLKN